MVREVDYIKPETNSTYPLGDTQITVDLGGILSEVEERIAELEKKTTKENVIVLRDLSREQAKNEIRELFKKGQTLYYSDIVRNLGIDLGTVVSICDELRENGEIEIDENV